MKTLYYVGFCLYVLSSLLLLFVLLSELDYLYRKWDLVCIVRANSQRSLLSAAIGIMRFVVACGVGTLKSFLRLMVQASELDYLY